MKQVTILLVKTDAMVVGHADVACCEEHARKTLRHTRKTMRENPDEYVKITGIEIIPVRVLPPLGCTQWQ